MKKGMHTITLDIKKEEYQQLEKEASRCGMTVSDYVRARVEEGGVFKVDTSFLEENTRELIELEDIIRGLYHSYLVTGKYQQADILKLQEVAERTEKNYNDVSQKLAQLGAELDARVKAHRASTPSLARRSRKPKLKPLPEE